MKKTIAAVTLLAVATLSIISLTSSKTDSNKQLTPFLAIKADIPELISEMEKRNPDKPELKQVKSTLALLGSIDLKNLELQLFYLNENLQPLLHVNAPSGTLQNLANLSFIKKQLTKREDGLWLVNSGDIELDSSIVATELNGKVIAGTEPIIKEVLTTKTIPTATVLTDIQKEFAGRNPEILLASRIGKNLGDKVDQVINKNIKSDMGFIVRMISAAAKSIISQLDNLSSVAVAVEMDGDKRQIYYSQSYHDKAKAEQFLKEVKAPDYEPGFDDSVRGVIAESAKNKELTHEITTKDNRVIYQFKWMAENDKKALDTLGKSTVGAFMSRAMMSSTMEPATHPISSELQSPPILNTEFSFTENLEQLKATIKANIITDSAYSNRIRNEFIGSKIPNMEFASIEWKIITIKDQAGKDIQIDKKDRYDTVYNKSGGTSAKFQKGDEIKPKTTIFEFNLKSAPKDLQVVWLDKSDLKKTKMIKGGKVLLQTLDNNVVKLKAITDKTKLKAFFYNKDGFCLDTSSSSSNSKSYAANVQGTVEKVQLVLYNTEELNKKFTIEIPFSKEETQPTPDFVKLTKHGVKTNYSDNVTEQLLNNLKIELDKDKLILDLKNGQLDFKHDWNFNLFGKEGELNKNIYPSNQSGKLRAFLRPEKNGIAFVSGNVNLKFRTDFSKVTFNKDEKEKTVTLKDGTKVTLKVIDNKVELSGMTREHKIISALGFNDKKQIFEVEQNSDKCEFWGTPNQIEIVISSGTVSKTVPFEFELSKDYDPKALQNYKTMLENEKKLLPVLIEVAKKWNKSSWDLNNFPGFAGFYYLCKNGKQMKHVAKEIADSDPVSADTFRYECKPYMNYHFTFPKTAEGKPTLSEHKRSYLFWENGKEIRKDHLAFQSSIPVIVTPAQKGLPAYMINSFGHVYRLNGEGYQLDSVDKKSFPKDAKQLHR